MGGAVGALPSGRQPNDRAAAAAPPRKCLRSMGWRPGVREPILTRCEWALATVYPEVIDRFHKIARWMMLSVNNTIQVPETEFEWSFVRSGGPGGQNVNKVASKAVLRWNVTASPSLPDDVKARFLTKHRRR